MTPEQFDRHLRDAMKRDPLFGVLAKRLMLESVALALIAFAIGLLVGGTYL